MAEATYYGTGRRKTSVARVRLVAGQGSIMINGRELTDYFDLKTLELIVKQPLELTGTTAAYDVIASVKGGSLNVNQRSLKTYMTTSCTFFLFAKNNSILYIL